MKNNTHSDCWLSRIGLGLIFWYCLSASIFFSYFAQMHLTLSFLPFPIFIGEIVMFISMILLAWVSRDGQSFDRRSVLLLGLYFGWVFIRVLINYHYDGALTCRNAALFYYPIFAVFAYAFYQKAKISHQVLMSLVFLLGSIMFLKGMVVWCWWTYVMLYAIAVWNIKSVPLRFMAWVFLAMIFLLGPEYLYKGPRAHFVSIFGAILFLVSYFGALFIKRGKLIQASILFLSLVLLGVSYFTFSNHNDISSVTSLKQMINTFNAFDKRYQADLPTYVRRNLSVHLYNPKTFKEVFPSPACTVPPPQAPVAGSLVGNGEAQALSPNSAVPLTAEEMKKFHVPHWLRKIISNEILSNRIRNGRDLDVDESNIVFRLFVWRDMARELIKEKAWWGFSFGHPQRSESLEVLKWAESEWGRDGWITPHNSFFHIIYRAGVLGLALIIILFVMIGGLIKDFFRMNSVEGGLLVGALVYWLILSNFFVILEFPYNAIIFWTLFGITWGYRADLRNG